MKDVKLMGGQETIKYLLIDGKTVTITKKSYSMWQNFAWQKKQSTTKLANRKFVARDKYNHINEATYYSLYDNKDIWQVNVNARAVK